MAEDTLHNTNIIGPAVDLARQRLTGAMRAHLSGELILSGNRFNNAPGGFPGDRPRATLRVMDSREKEGVG
jgi:hypothetical protein